MAIDEAERIKLSKVVNKMTRVLCFDSTFVDCVNIRLNFAIAFEGEYNEKFVKPVLPTS